MAKTSNIKHHNPIGYQTAKKKWSTEFIKEQQKRKKLDEQVCTDTTFKNVIGKLSSKGNFVANDENDLNTFVSRISDPRYKNSIHIYNFINNFSQKSYFDLVKLFNLMMASNNYGDLQNNLTSIAPMTPNQSNALPYLFSIVKHYQDPNKYPFMYIFWMNLCDVFFPTASGTFKDYDQLCDVYNKVIIPSTDKPKHSYFSAYMDALARYLANEIKPNIGTYTKDAIESVFNIPNYDELLGFNRNTTVKASSNPTQTQTSTPSPVSVPKNVPTNKDDETRHPLNLILYGPPGTGKTYNTVNEALSIIEGKKIEDLQNENREDVLERFNQYKEKGQIVFTTFHQSLSYEEFIEGIKPIPGKNDVVATHNNATNPTPGATQFGEGTTTFENLKIMQYKPQDGIFKKLCDKALKNPTEVVTSSVIKKTSVVPSTLTIDQLLDKFTKEVKAKGKIVITIDDAEWEITKEKSFRVKKANRAQDFPVTDKTIKRDWDNFKNGEIESANDIKPTQNSKSDSLGTKEEHWVLYNALRDFENELLQKEQNIVAQDVETTETITENVPQNYVLIIDEINRGNVSQIFGELITLIEEDKRTTRWDKVQKQYVDNPEKITVKLPYSPDEEPFGVPGNLYIIGTMNTADRSVEALDTALRRRFDFKEMMPNPKLLDEQDCKKDWQDDLKDLLENKVNKSLKEILETINNRIRVLKDREHQIGHSYFMKCKTVEDLKNVFKNNIVPLLQEYFYGNYAYIGLVLGNRFVLKDEEANNPKFATFDGKEAFENNTDTQYKLLDEKGWRELPMKDALQQLIGQQPS